MKVLVVGSGAREYAMLWKLWRSSRMPELFAAPGNGGTERWAQNVPIQATDVDGLARFAQENDIDITIVGPETALEVGIVPFFHERGLRIFGPDSFAASIETSKAMAKLQMLRMEIPTADFRIFTSYNEALRYVRAHGAPIVVKASGLAQGKGVYVCRTLEAAEEALLLVMVDKIHGPSAGAQVVVEELLEGREVSIHAFCDGKTAKIFPVSRDEKQIYPGGPNTGGMGAYSPVPWAPEGLLQEVKERIIDPLLAGLAQMGHPFVGCLYPGLMLTSEGPKVLEFNARFGDPETQAYMRKLKTDLLEIIEACLEGRLDAIEIEWDPGFAVCVVLASAGYPGEPETGFLISGIEDAEKIPGVAVFHAATKEEHGQLITAGGRVLRVTAFAETPQEARAKVYDAIRLLHFSGMQFRQDIALETLI